MNRFTKPLVVALMFSALSFTPANSQLAQTWDMQARAKAESATSAGVTMLQKRQVDAAISTFEKATRFDPNDPAPYTMLGLALAMRGKYEEALHALERSYSLNKSSEALISTGFVYYLQHDYPAAITAWNRALEISPKLCQVYGNIGFAHLRQGHFSDADEQFRKLVKCKPNSNYGYQGIALIHYMRGNLKSARAAADRAQLTEPSASMVLLLAKLDALQGDRAGALKRAQQYTAMMRKKNAPERKMTEFGLPGQHDFWWDPLRVDTFDNGYLLSARLQDPLQFKKQASLASQGKAGAAIQSAQAGLQEDPRDLFLMRELGLAQMANANYAEATETFKRVMDNCPTCYVDLLHIGRSLAMQKRGEEGAVYIKEYQNHHPQQRLSPVLATIGPEPEVTAQEAAQEAQLEQIKPEKTAKAPKVKEEKPVKEPKPAKAKSTGAGEQAPTRTASPSDDNTIPASEF
jgi:Flp pilus assembly protein TadD